MWNTFEIERADRLSEVIDCGRWKPYRVVQGVPWKRQRPDSKGPYRHALPPWLKIGKWIFAIQPKRADYHLAHKIIVARIGFSIPLTVVPYESRGHDFYIVAPSQTPMMPDAPDAPLLLAPTKELVEDGLAPYRRTLDEVFPLSTPVENRMNTLVALMNMR